MSSSRLNLVLFLAFALLAAAMAEYTWNGHDWVWSEENEEPGEPGVKSCLINIIPCRANRTDLNLLYSTYCIDT